jgi:peptidoglycan/LPS O-acetylase OafA/YrhL
MAHPTQSPLDYVVRNASLIIRQGDVAAVTGQLIGGGWNVSIWSLSYEFQCYLVLALFGFGGLLSSGRTAVVLLLILLVVARLNTEMPGAGGVNPLLSQYMWSIRLGVNFTIGVLAYLYRDRLTMSWQTALALVIAAELVAKTPMWWVVAPFAVGYLGLYLGSSPRLAFWDKFGDYSYGAYLYGSVVTQALVFYGMNRWGFVPFFLMIVAGVAPLAFLSYRVIELPATHVARRLAAMVSGKRVGPAQSLPSPVSVTHSTEMVAP